MLGASQMHTSATEDLDREEFEIQLAIALSLNDSFATAVPEAEVEAESCVIVKNFGKILTDEFLADMFLHCGTVIDAQVQRHANGESKGKYYIFIPNFTILHSQ